MTSRAGPDNSRASNAFWMFPPDSRPIGVSTLGVRMSNVLTRARAWAAMRPICSKPAVQKGASPISLSSRFVATGKAPTVPSPNRSSVI